MLVTPGWFQELSIPTLWRATANFEGGGVSKFLKECVKLQWNFQWGGVLVGLRLWEGYLYGYFLERHDKGQQSAEITNILF